MRLNHSFWTTAKTEIFCSFRTTIFSLVLSVFSLDPSSVCSFICRSCGYCGEGQETWYFDFRIKQPKWGLPDSLEICGYVLMVQDYS